MLKRKVIALVLALPMVLSVSCKKETKESSKQTSKETANDTTKETDDTKLTSINSADITFIDPFKDLVVTIGGIEGFPEVTFDTSACDEIIQKHVTYEYTTEDDFLNVGEFITVKAILDTENPDVKNKYSIANDTKEYEAKREDLNCVYYLQSSATDIQNYIDDEFLPSVKQEFFDRMKLPVQTEKGELQVESCDTKLQICGLYLFLNVFSDSEDSMYVGDAPITDIFIPIWIYGNVNGTITETSEQVQGYTANHYAILHIGFPVKDYHNEPLGELKVQTAELLFADDMDSFMENVEGLDEKKAVKSIYSYIKRNFSDKLNAPSLMEHDGWKFNLEIYKIVT